MSHNQNQVRISGRKLNKTYVGTGAFFVSSFIISVIALYFNRMVFDLKTFWLALGIAVVSTLTELFSVKGIDNLLIPLSVVMMLLLFN